MVTHTGARSNTIPHALASVQTAVVRLWVQTQRWSRVGADLRRAVVSIDEIDGQKHGSASYAVNNHTKRNSTGRKFINTNDTPLRLRTDTGYLRFTSVQTAVVRLWVETQRWSRVGADLRRAVVSIDEIDGQKHGSASYAVNNHTKRNSTGRKFINTNDTPLRLRTDTGYVRWHMDQC